MLGEELALVCVLDIAISIRARDARSVGEEDSVRIPSLSQNGHGPHRLRDTRLIAAIGTRHCARPIVVVHPLPRPWRLRLIGIVPLKAA